MARVWQLEEGACGRHGRSDAGIVVIDRGRREARKAAFGKAARAANGALRLAEPYFVAALTSLKTVLI
jgi:hypothetical protein